LAQGRGLVSEEADQARLLISAKRHDPRLAFTTLLLEFMTELGMERLYVRRKCQVCPGEIPRWTGVGKKRRAVPISRVTCSPKCQKKLQVASKDAQKAILTNEAP
jgi:hypothetical protein